MVTLESLKQRPGVKKYLAWLASSDLEKRIAKKAWQEYYVKVKDTRAARRFFKIRELYKKGDIGNMKLYCKKAHEQIINGDWELTEPTYFCEWEPGWDVFLYKQSLLSEKS